MFHVDLPPDSSWKWETKEIPEGSILISINDLHYLYDAARKGGYWWDKNVIPIESCIRIKSLLGVK